MVSNEIYDQIWLDLWKLCPYIRCGLQRNQAGEYENQLREAFKRQEKLLKSAITQNILFRKALWRSKHRPLGNCVQNIYAEIQELAAVT